MHHSGGSRALHRPQKKEKKKAISPHFALLSLSHALAVGELNHPRLRPGCDKAGAARLLTCTVLAVVAHSLLHHHTPHTRPLRRGSSRWYVTRLSVAVATIVGIRIPPTSTTTSSCLPTASATPAVVAAAGTRAVSRAVTLLRVILVLLLVSLLLLHNLGRWVRSWLGDRGMCRRRWLRRRRHLLRCRARRWRGTGRGRCGLIVVVNRRRSDVENRINDRRDRLDLGAQLRLDTVQIRAVLVGKERDGKTKVTKTTRTTTTCQQEHPSLHSHSVEI